MIKYILDTNAWLNLREDPSRLSERSLSILSAETQFAVSPISIVEIAQLIHKGRLSLKCTLETWTAKSLDTIVTLIPISPAIAIEAYRIPEFHEDPADRIIASTSRLHNLTLATSDLKFISHPNIHTLSTR